MISTSVVLFTLVGEIAEPGRWRTGGYASGVVWGLVSGLSIWWGYWANERSKIPLDEKFRWFTPLKAQEWDYRTAWMSEVESPPVSRQRGG